MQIGGFGGSIGASLHAANSARAGGTAGFAAAMAQAASASPGAQTSGTTTDFTRMTRKDLLGWVNDKIRSGAMSLDDSTALVAMTAKLRVDGGDAAIDATEQVDFTAMAQGGLEWARQHSEASSVRAFETALSIMNRYQGESKGVDRLA